jgi:nucleotide-binding universal stress UspA family protein
MYKHQADVVIVGVDGSQTAEAAALWGAQEAASRGVLLRLLYVIKSSLATPLPAEVYRVELNKGKAALASAYRAVAANIPTLTVKTDVLQGDPAGVLVAESRFAAMICVGSTGIGRFSEAFLGSTSATVASDSACSVAIIRPAATGQPVDFQPRFVIAPVSIFTDNSDVVVAAAGRARHHHCPVLAVGIKDNDLGATPYDVLDSLVDGWRRDYSDVTWYPVPTNSGLHNFLHAHPELSAMVVLNSEADKDISAIVRRIPRDPTTGQQLIVFIDRDHPTIESSTEHDAASVGGQASPQ